MLTPVAVGWKLSSVGKEGKAMTKQEEARQFAREHFGMKPETFKRRQRERAAMIKARRADLEKRLREKAESDPEGIWAELLEDFLSVK